MAGQFWRWTVLAGSGAVLACSGGCDVIPTSGGADAANTTTGAAADVSDASGIGSIPDFRDRPSGLIISSEDAVERALFGIGNHGCSGTLDFFNPGIPAAAFRSEVFAFREQVKPFSNFGTFSPEGDLHTLIAFDDFYTASAGGVKLIDWFSRIVRGETPGHAGP